MCDQWHLSFLLWLAATRGGNVRLLAQRIVVVFFKLSGSFLNILLRGLPCCASFRTLYRLEVFNVVCCQVYKVHILAADAWSKRYGASRIKNRSLGRESGAGGTWENKDFLRVEMLYFFKK